MATVTIKLQDEVSSSAKSINASLKQLQDSLGQMSNSTQGASQKMSGLTQSLSSSAAGSAEMSGGLAEVGAEATVATGGLDLVVVAALGLVAAAGAASVALGELMSKAIDVNEAAAHLKTVMQAFTGDGQGSVEMINRLSAALPQSRSQISGFAEDLAKAGLRGKELESAVMAAAGADALQSGMATAFTGIIKQIDRMAEGGKKLKFDKIEKDLQNIGLSGPDGLKKVADAMGITVEKLKKGSYSADELRKGIIGAETAISKEALDEKALSFESMFAKLQDSLNSVFKDPEIVAAIIQFKTACKDLFEGVFGKGTTANTTLAAIIKGILVPAFQYATLGVKYLHLGILILINYFLLAKAAIKAWMSDAQNIQKLTDLFNILKMSVKVCLAIFSVVGSMLKDMFSDKGGSQQIDIWTILKAVAIGVGTAIATVALIILIAVAGFKMLYEQICFVVDVCAFIIGGMLDVASSLYNFTGLVLSILGWLVSAGYDAAANFIAGLVDGISSRGSDFIASVSNLVHEAIDVVTSTLGIHSPSAVMRIHGEMTGLGMAQGMDSSSAQVASAASNMANAAIPNMSGKSSPQDQAGGKSGSHITVESGAVVINGVGSSGQAIEMTESAFSLLLERLALERGVLV